ncbi:MAG: hypothetical protein WKF97_26520 [Chitinophagaceae bacterium]
MIRFFSTLSSLLLIILFLIFKNRNKEKKLWVIFFYILLSFLFDLSFFTIGEAFNIPEFYLYVCFTLTEYTIFSIFFYLTYQRKAFKWLVVSCYPGFLAITYYLLANSKNYSFDSLTASFEGIFIIIFSILFFYEQLTHPEVTFIYASKYFWIIVAMLIYLSATLFLFIAATYLSLNDFERLSIINGIANITKNILIAIAFIIPTTKLIRHSSGKSYNM